MRDGRLLTYVGDMARCLPQHCSSYRSADVAALFYVLLLSILGLAGMPVRYILLVLAPLAMSVAASLSLARLELKRRRALCAR